MSEIIRAEINEMNLLGNGITKQDGCVVFCLGAVDGDTVTCDITQEKKNFKIANILTFRFWSFTHGSGLMIPSPSKI